MDENSNLARDQTDRVPLSISRTQHALNHAAKSSTYIITALPYEQIIKFIYVYYKSLSLELSRPLSNGMSTDHMSN